MQALSSWVVRWLHGVRVSAGKNAGCISHSLDAVYAPRSKKKGRRGQAFGITESCMDRMQHVTNNQSQLRGYALFYCRIFVKVSRLCPIFIVPTLRLASP